MQKISDLKELSNGQVFIKIIRSKLDNQTITSVYTPSVNYYLIKKYFLGSTISFVKFYNEIGSIFYLILRKVFSILQRHSF